MTCLHITNMLKKCEFYSELAEYFLFPSSFTFFFFLNQQFITRRTMADRGSYFRNYVQKKHTNMRNEES